MHSSLLVCLAKPAQTHGLGYAESLTKQVGMTGALGDPDDTELVDMSTRYRAISQRPISTNSAIRRISGCVADYPSQSAWGSAIHARYPL
jgi:hypothetical protein